MGQNGKCDQRRRDAKAQRVLRLLKGSLLLDMIILSGILVLDIRMVIDVGKGQGSAAFLPSLEGKGS